MRATSDASFAEGLSVPVYEYYCRTCNTKFEKLQPMTAASEAVNCPEGHEGAKRTLSLVARMSGSSSDDAFQDWSPSAAGGCGCGGACSCGSFGAN